MRRGEGGGRLTGMFAKRQLGGSMSGVTSVFLRRGRLTGRCAVALEEDLTERFQECVRDLVRHSRPLSSQAGTVKRGFTTFT